ncbi:MAG: DAK2 domain-containing protein [Lachnospiraceae bacterium]|nr:DAK2 domain-containing protein [Lachnospiraceae bacterium]
MKFDSLSAALIYGSFLAGAGMLNSQKEYINELNVFPVPDGDTGTNMSMTMMSAVSALNEVSDTDSLEQVCKAVSNGSLRGARGNSGVILSQLLRGFTKTLSEAGRLDAGTAAMAFNKATETAYKAVMKPKEGTILTVARAMAEKASQISADTDDVLEFLDQVIDYGNAALERTPEILPVLKQAGVVDSGGQGLIYILMGARDYLKGEISDDEVRTQLSIQKSTGGEKTSYGAKVEQTKIKFGYCTEFIILLKQVFNQKSESDFKEFLESIGDSIVCVAMDDVVKVHVHTNDPGLAIQRAMKYGQLNCIKIDNMRIEHHERVLRSDELRKAGVKKIAGDNEPVREDTMITLEKEPKTYGFVAVCAGDGLKSIFESLGADQVLEGGQTMNPSTDDLLKAVAKVNARNIFILPNNKNIILAANQAAKLSKDKRITVIPTTGIPQGVAALIAFDETGDTESNEKEMKDAALQVKTGQVTYAVRDTLIDDKDIKQGDIMGIGEGRILAVGNDAEDTAFDMVCEMVDEESSLVSIYFGEESDEEKAASLSNRISERFPEVEVEVDYGGQPIYYYIISVE